MRDCDVVVVGGGPGGSTTAETLAAAGFEVLVFERSEFPGKSNVCGGMFCMACAKDFKIDPSIFEKVIYKGIHFFGFATIDLNNKDGYVMVLRDRFDNYLANRADNRGAKLITCATVTDIRVLETGLVEVTFRLKQGSVERVKARVIVLADGPNSLSQLFPDFGFRKSPKNLSFAFSCDVEAKDNTMDHFEMYYDRNLADWGYGWVFPKKDMFNFGLVCRFTECEKDKSVIRERLKYLWEVHPRASLVLKGKRLIRRRGAMIPQKIAKRIVRDSVVVVGDAAGMADAVMGGGIENAMYAGKMAGDVLAEGLKEDRLDAEYLGRYQTLWESSERYKMTSAAERFRDWGCRLDRLNPNISNKSKYLFALRSKRKQMGVSGILSDAKLLLSQSYRREMEILAEELPVEF